MTPERHAQKGGYLDLGPGIALQSRAWARLSCVALLGLAMVLAGCDDDSGSKVIGAFAQTNSAEGGPTASSGPRGLRLCNTTGSRVGVAIGYKDSNGWATEGWWNVASHTCETLLKGNLIARYYYIHAIDYDRGGEWAGKAFLCTDDKAFTIRGTGECTKRGYKRTGFFEIDTGEERGWTVRLTDPAEGEARSQ